MKLEIISAKMTDPQARLMKKLVSQFKDSHKDVRINGPKFGKIADAILMSMKIDENHYVQFIKILLGNDINVLFTKNTNPKTKQIIEEFEGKRKEAELRKKLRLAEEDHALEASASGRKQNADKSITIQDVDRLIKEGNYQEILRISRSINCVPKVVEHAAASIGDAARNLIEELRFNGLGNKNKSDESIGKLISIASDKNLRVTNDISILKEAGSAAIEVAATNPDSVDELIKICNNNSLHHSVTVEAAVKFSELVFADEDYYKDDLDIAVRSLSTRWMNIAFDVAGRDMSSEDIEKYNQLLDYVDSKR